MTAFGVVLIVVGGVSATWSVVMSCRANPDTAVPWVFGKPPHRPWQVQALAGLAGGSSVLGVLLLSDTLGYWGALVASSLWTGAFAVQHRHNRSATHHARGSA